MNPLRIREVVTDCVNSSGIQIAKSIIQFNFGVVKLIVPLLVAVHHHLENQLRLHHQELACLLVNFFLILRIFDKHVLDN
mmetsp:Transcript_20868/g.22330  ORF Transcript_20868/g.22330 Transcript_20868/m.22330 type:complete len:80 (-) Transcript_20868:571-810(-)